MKLKPKGIAVANGLATLQLDGDKDIHELELTVRDIGTLVSMLYSARDKLLSIPADETPQGPLLIHRLTLGELEDGHPLMRVHVSETLYHDFVAEDGSEIAVALRALAAARGSSQVVPFGGESRN